ncbi:hypothetical protein HHI36_019661 [Cryptolaemus montrouzieri]|uniref:Uncharacterized protein n=1 Tax=Cryptolaemus montrouzieri TaxID=559131 RepID=A0ABD2N959_9CUCU
MIVCSDDKSDLEIGSGQTIKHSDSFRYLGGKWKKFNNVSNKIAQGKRVIRQLNLMLWNKKLIKKLHLIYDTIFETHTYGAETWKLTQREKDRLKALEMDFSKQWSFKIGTREK